jgi:hypothetical protein
MIDEFPKIETLFHRGEDHKVRVFDWRTPELEYLAGTSWELTEKVDGTNIRVALEFQATYGNVDMEKPENWGVNFYGRTAQSQMPAFLLARLEAMFLPKENLEALWRGQKGCELCGGFGRIGPATCKCVVPYPITLYGEGYGARIQKGGGNYIPDGVNFTLFDVRIGDKWLARSDVYEVAAKLGISHVPIVAVGNLHLMLALVAGTPTKGVYVSGNGVKSTWGDFQAEGLVARPLVELQDGRGRRIISKLKTSDF